MPYAKCAGVLQGGSVPALAWGSETWLLLITNHDPVDTRGVYLEPTDNVFKT